MLEILDLGRKGLYDPCSKIKGADQLCGFVFLLAKLWFSQNEAQIYCCTYSRDVFVYDKTILHEVKGKQ